MRALQVTETVGPAGVRVSEVDPPAVPDGGVLIEVRTCGLSFPDLLLSQGKYQLRPEPPFTLGVEAAGVVREAAASSGFKAGDQVTVYMGVGACAELVAATPENVLRLPPPLGFEEGAALTMNYHTCHFALLRRAGLRAGETLLVHGATGGVGTAAIQLARAYGARVLAVVSSDRKAEVAREMGADEVIMSGGDWAGDVRRHTEGRGVDVVFDPVGGSRFDESLRLLAPEGRLLVIGFAEGSIPQVGVNRLLLRNVSVVGAGWGAFIARHPEHVEEVATDLARLVAEGSVKPLVTAVYPLEEAVRGLEAIAERRVIGKSVVRVS
jgi:NADPH2:quinone reductase